MLELPRTTEIQRPLDSHDAVLLAAWVVPVWAELQAPEGRGYWQLYCYLLSYDFGHCQSSAHASWTGIALYFNAELRPPHPAPALKPQKSVSWMRSVDVMPGNMPTMPTLQAESTIVSELQDPPRIRPGTTV